MTAAGTSQAPQRTLGSEYAVIPITGLATLEESLPLVAGDRAVEELLLGARVVEVVVDHLVAGSKETRIADEVRLSPVGQHVLVVGHPYVDVWAAVKPERLGLEQWPDIPRSEEWKKGVCRRLGWPHATQADVARAWKRILGTVRTYADLDPAFLGRVEELIDFVTAP